jgi:hypothetical protein
VVGCNGRLDLGPNGGAGRDAAQSDIGVVDPGPLAEVPGGTDGSSDNAPDLTVDTLPVVIDAPVGDASVGADAPADLARDAVLDVPGGGDVSLGSDGPRDATNEASDASGPFVCTSDSTCNLQGRLHCLIVPGQPGRCVECTGNGHCVKPSPNPTPLCDLVLNRCVECVVASDCPSPSSIYPSTCTPVSRHCQTGCEDDLTTACPTTRRYHCVDDLYLCVECQPATAAIDCAGSPHGTLCHPSEFVCVSCLATSCPVGMTCDPLTARCVQCRTSRDCRDPGMPLCDPATLTCVPVPP